MSIKVKLALLKMKLTGQKPSIDRTNYRQYNCMGKHYVGPSKSGKFFQINDGLRIRYYGNPFWNLYRVTSFNNTDYTIKRAR
jgi:hypothetical protein